MSGLMRTQNPVDSTLTVRYDPKEPTSAVLSAGWNWAAADWTFLGGSGWLFDVAVKTAETPANG